MGPGSALRAVRDDKGSSGSAQCWVLALDQLELPLASPPLDALLAQNRLVHVAVLLEVDEQLHRVSLGESGHQAFAMLMSAADQVIGVADVEGAIATAREDVDEVRV